MKSLSTDEYIFQCAENARKKKERWNQEFEQRQIENRQKIIDSNLSFLKGFDIPAWLLNYWDSGDNFLYQEEKNPFFIGFEIPKCAPMSIDFITIDENVIIEKYSITLFSRIIEGKTIFWDDANKTCITEIYPDNPDFFYGLSTLEDAIGIAHVQWLKAQEALKEWEENQTISSMSVHIHNSLDNDDMEVYDNVLQADIDKIVEILKGNNNDKDE